MPNYFSAPHKPEMDKRLLNQNQSSSNSPFQPDYRIGVGSTVHWRGRTMEGTVLKELPNNQVLVRWPEGPEVDSLIDLVLIERSAEIYDN